MYGVPFVSKLIFKSMFVNRSMFAVCWANLVHGNRCFEGGRAMFSNIASKIQHRSNGKHRLVSW